MRRGEEEGLQLTDRKRESVIKALKYLRFIWDCSMMYNYMKNLFFYQKLLII